MSLAPLELLSAHPWERVTFTTYALSLSFFEAVILDALIRGARCGGQEALILDMSGDRPVRSGAHCHVATAVFHRKRAQPFQIISQAGSEEIRVMPFNPSGTSGQENGASSRRTATMKFLSSASTL